MIKRRVLLAENQGWRKGEGRYRLRGDGERSGGERGARSGSLHSDGRRRGPGPRLRLCQRDGGARKERELANVS